MQRQNCCVQKDTSGACRLYVHFSGCTCKSELLQHRHWLCLVSNLLHLPEKEMHEPDADDKLWRQVTRHRHRDVTVSDRHEGCELPARCCTVTFADTDLSRIGGATHLRHATNDSHHREIRKKNYLQLFHSQCSPVHKSHFIMNTGVGISGFQGHLTVS